jgi:hypothetical protein
MREVFVTTQNTASVCNGSKAATRLMARMGGKLTFALALLTIDPGMNMSA